MPVTWANRIAGATRLVLAAIFLVAGLSKLTHLAQFEEVLAGFQLFPLWVLPVFKVALPCAEVSIGLWLLLNRATRWAALSSAALLAAMIAVVTVTLLRHLTPDCGCFIGLGERAVSWRLVAVDALLLAGSFFVASRATCVRRSIAAPAREEDEERRRDAPSVARPVYLPALRAVNRSWLLLAGILLSLACGAAFVRHAVVQPMRMLAHEGPELGEPLPNARWVGMNDGAPWEARKLAEQNVLLVFIKADCSHCRDSLPEVEKLYKEVQHDKGFRVLLVSESYSEPTAELARELQISVPVVLDGTASMRTQFALFHTPAFLWYRHGVLYDKGVGAQALGEIGERIRRARAAQSTVAQR